MLKSLLNRNTLIIATGLVTGGYLVWFFSDIVSYLLISFIIAAILRTPTNYINQAQFLGMKMPRVLAIFISFGILFSLIGLFVILFAPLVSQQFENIISIDIGKNLTDLERTLHPKNKEDRNILVDIESFLRTYQVLDSETGIVLALKNYILGTQWIKKLKLISILNNLLSFTGNFFITLLAVLFITFFILYEKGGIRRYLLSLVPNRYFEVTIVAVTKIERMLSNYLLGILLQMISIFTVAAFGLILVGVDYAITIAVFAAVMNLVPFLGPMMGALFGLIVGISTNSELAEANSELYLILMGKIIAVFAVVQLADNLFLQPLIFSKSVQAHPLEIFLIVFVGANLAGAVGMILAIPTYTILKVSFTEFFKGYKQYRIFRNG